MRHVRHHMYSTICIAGVSGRQMCAIKWQFALGHALLVSLCCIREWGEASRRLATADTLLPFTMSCCAEAKRFVRQNKIEQNAREQSNAHLKALHASMCINVAVHNEPLCSRKTVCGLKHPLSLLRCQTHAFLCFRILHKCIRTTQVRKACARSNARSDKLFAPLLNLQPIYV